MKRTILTPVALLALGTLALGGCSAFENLGGGKKVSPDEFKIVSYSPLTMPPNAELRPPRPGAPRPQEVTPADQAKEALSPALAGRPQRNAVFTGTSKAVPTSSEQALVQRAGGSNIDPEIRSRVNQDTKTINDSDKSFIDGLIFWQDTPPSGVVLDPTKEQQRIRDAQASGQPATGATPTITRRQRGLLEGIF
ncbi:DUF3035 domain-containing protein [Reyranella sp.]|uniref:DUF3035 domain-containing protein n=1 Tax=Reyranella sp. TaxID=1929291 RepID=UPI003BAB7347